MRKILAVGASCAALLTPMAGQAADMLATLTPGEYVAGADCSGLGGAGSMYFDGKNFSGHYMICRTVAGPDTSGKIVSKCIEVKGEDYQRLEKTDITKSPDATSVTQILKVTTPKEFRLDKQKFTFCEAAR